MSDTNHNKTTTNLTEEEYLKQLAAEFEMEQGYYQLCQYGHCCDAAWQEGIQI